MNDRDFLFWIHERMVWQGNDPHMDYMHKLRAIIRAYPADKQTPNIASDYPMEYPPEPGSGSNPEVAERAVEIENTEYRERA